MKERGILFGGPMVRAILDGKKTQTRRVVTKLNPTFVAANPTGEQIANAVRCPYGQPGDALYVKEAAWMWCERRPNGHTPTGRAKWLFVPLESAPVIYAADRAEKPSTAVVSPDTGNAWGWRFKVARFLPRWASRLSLTATGVRVERLQEISEADAHAEGVDLRYCGSGNGCTCEQDIVGEFAELWNSINASRGYGWDVNPWVWVIEFQPSSSSEEASSPITET